ncbi:MAG: HAD-IIA family hydrolase [Christensenellales bacterium]
MINLLSAECFILDMDGTVYIGNKAIDGAKELLSFFTEHGISYRFFTNNSSRNPKDYAQKLKSLKFGRQPRVITSADVSADYIIKTFGANARVYTAGTKALHKQLKDYGILCTENNPDCVLVGFDTSYDYKKARKAVSLLRDGLPFLATNVDAVCPLEDGNVIPDCASICAMLSHASGRSPLYLGKPSVYTANYILAATGVPAGKTAVVGDRLYTDLKLAVDNGMCAVGVLSGEMTKKDIDESPFKPHYIFESVFDLYQSLKRQIALKSERI